MRPNSAPAKLESASRIMSKEKVSVPFGSVTDVSDGEMTDAKEAVQNPAISRHAENSVSIVLLKCLCIISP